MINVVERLRNQTTIYDGAKGTFLAEYVINIGDPTDLLNLRKPSVVLDVHEAYINAGSGLIQTNTFCANSLRLALNGLGPDDAYQISRQGAYLATLAASNHNVLVAGDIGPTGKMPEPWGDTSVKDMTQAFIPQIEGLIAGGHLRAAYEQ